MMMIRFPLAVLISCIYIAEANHREVIPTYDGYYYGYPEPYVAEREPFRGHHGEQPYCSYIITAEEARAEITSIINFGNPTPFQRSYAALLFTIHKAGADVARGVDFDRVYDAAVDMVTYGAYVPEYARDFTLNCFAEIEDNINPIQSWVHQILKEDGNLESCDKKVNYLVRKYPASQRSARLAVEIGKLTRMFNSLKQEIEIVTQLNVEQSYVEKGKNRLGPLILQAAAAYKAIRNWA